ncbi:MAG: hypothetical protein IKJ65_08750 [Clostridia bacterium]|nr:hypothetical protein [Clostridia bacterium]
MIKTNSFTLDYYNKCIIKRIIDKYGLEPMEAARSFLTSETHAMLEDEECAMWEFSERAIFDMWEVERVTGNPRNSVYISGK